MGMTMLSHFLLREIETSPSPSHDSITFFYFFDAAEIPFSHQLPESRDWPSANQNEIL